MSERYFTSRIYSPAEDAILRAQRLLPGERVWNNYTKRWHMGDGDRLGGIVQASLDDVLAYAPGADWLDAGTYIKADGVTDDTAGLAAAYAAALATGRGLLLPPGRIRATANFNKNVAVRGRGPGTSVGDVAKGTRFVPVSNNVTVVTIGQAIGAGDVSFRSNNMVVEGFAIDLTGFTGCIGLKTVGLFNATVGCLSVFDRNGITTAQRAGANNLGWWQLGDQYSSFYDIYIERCRFGRAFTDDPAGGFGGGINNSFRNLHLAYCQINDMIYRASNSPYPMGFNVYENYMNQDSFHCAMYVQGQGSTTFSGFTPEECSASVDTLTVNPIGTGNTPVVKRSVAHIVGSLVGYDVLDYSITGGRDVPIIAESNSVVTVTHGTGAAINYTCDDTSLFSYRGTAGNESTFVNVQAEIIVGGPYYHVIRSFGGPDGRVDPNVRNVASSRTVPQITGGDVPSLIDGDPTYGAVARLNFAATAGSAAANRAIFNSMAGGYPTGTIVAWAILLMSSIDATYKVDFAQSLAGATIAMKAGQWRRLFLTNYNDTGATKDDNVIIYPTTPGGPSLKLARQAVILNATFAEIAAFSRAHLFNPLDELGAVHRATAPPTTGTWPVGHYVYNSAPAPGQPVYWVCTTAGTGGAAVFKSGPSLAA